MVSRIVVALGNVEGAADVSARPVGGAAIGSRPAGGVTLTGSDSTGGTGVTVGVAASGKVAGGSAVPGRVVLGRVGDTVAGGTRTGMMPPAAAGKHSCGRPPPHTSQLQKAEGPGSTLVP